MVGVWEHNPKGRQVEVRLKPFAELPEWARGGAEAEAAQLAAFLGGEPAVNWQFGI